MDIPIISKRREAARKTVEAQAITKTLAAVGQSLEEIGEGDIAKSFLTGNAAALMSNKGGPSGGKPPGSSWSNQGGTSSKLIARVTQNLSQGFNQAPEELELALAEQGLSWGPPFPPGRPLDPFYGYRTPARTFNYSVGSNVQLTPRWNRVSFPTIKSIYEAYDVAQICVRHLINDVRSLDYNWEPIPGIKDDVSKEIEQALEFFYSPDKRQPFRTWLAEWLQDVLRYDAGALYIRRNNGGDPIALEVVDGTTIIPLVDFYGRRPEDETGDETSEGLFQGEVTPAYVQIIEGLPWDWLASSDLLYQPWNPLPDSQYGLAPLEAVLLSANTDIRFQWHFLQFFTEGTMPAGFMEAPPDMSDPAQVTSWQETWDTIMMGDQSKSRQIRWVPNGAKFTAAKPDADKFSPDFVLYLARRTMAAFGVTPNDLGFTEDVNRATGDTQIDVQFRVGTSPLLRYVEDVINLFVKEHLKLRVRLRFDDGKETEDRVATATADGIYLDHGVIGIDEVRAELGRPIDKSKPSPRYINNSRTGPIPLLALESMAGKVDSDTYGVADDQELIDTPYIPPPGVIPAAGTEELKGAAEASARAANTMREGTNDTGPTDEEQAEGAEEGAVADGTEEPTAVEKMLALLDEIKKGVGSSGIDNTGGPGLGKGVATTIVGGTDGITVPLGIEGADLLDDENDEDEVLKAAQVDLALRRWRDNSRNRLKKGQAPRKFVDPNLPPELYDEIWGRLSKARTREEVDRAFGKAGKAEAGQAGTPGFHRNTAEIIDYYAPLIAKAYEKLWSKAAIDRVIKAAAAKKSDAPDPPNLRGATDEKKSCGTCKMFSSDPSDRDEGLCWGYGNKRVDHSQVCDSWAAEVLKEAAPLPPSNTAETLRLQIDQTALQNVLEHLSGDAALQGTLESAVASSSIVSDALQCVVNQLPKDYWDKWKPGFGRAATQDLSSLREARGVNIKDLTDSAIERIDQAISDGLARGDSFQSIASGIRDDLGSTSRAEMVANTEYASAMTEANLETYRETAIEKVEWLAEGDACVECEENADASPIAIEDEWPNGDVPVHPNCRCAISPVVESVASDVEKALPGDIDGLFSEKSCAVVKPELPVGGEGKVAEAVVRSEEATSPAAKIGDRVHFQNGVDAQTGKPVEGGAGRIVRMDKQGNMMVNAGTPKKPVWVQTKQDALVTPEKAAAVNNPLGKTGYRARLTPEEAKALDEYKANGYRQLNSGLREGRQLGTTLQARADAIDRAIEKGTLSKDTRVFRAFRPDGGLKLEVGDVIKDDAFVSTATSAKTPTEILNTHAAKGEPFYLAKIDAKAGTHVAYADAGGARTAGLSQEDEIILPRGSSFRVTKVVINKYGGRELTLELISAAKSVGRILVITSDESTLISTISTSKSQGKS